jgi:hypothetical protein
MQIEPAERDPITLSELIENKLEQFFQECSESDRTEG